METNCPKTECLRKSEMIYCLGFSRYKPQSCPFYTSPVANPELRKPNQDGLDVLEECLSEEQFRNMRDADARRIEHGKSKGLDYDLDEKKVEENRGLEE